MRSGSSSNSLRIAQSVNVLHTFKPQISKFLKLANILTSNTSRTPKTPTVNRSAKLEINCSLYNTENITENMKNCPPVNGENTAELDSNVWHGALLPPSFFGQSVRWTKFLEFFPRRVSRDLITWAHIPSPLWRDGKGTLRISGEILNERVSYIAQSPVEQQKIRQNVICLWDFS